MSKKLLDVEPEEPVTNNAEENKFAIADARHLPTWLNEFESPIKWCLSLQSNMLNRLRIHKKVREYAEQDAESYVSKRYIYLLSVIAYQELGLHNGEPYIKSDKSDYSESEDESNLLCEEEKYNSEESYLMCKELLKTMASKEDNVMYQRFGPALEHILQALRVHMLYMQGNITESQQLSKYIQQVETMSNESKAGIEGMKGEFLLRNSKDNKGTLSIFLKANQLDPVFPKWIFLIGIVKKRIRRHFQIDINFEEIEYFAKALELEESSKYLLFLALAYQEMIQLIRRKPFKNCNDKRTIEELQIKAVDLFRRSWNLKNNTVAMCRRVGNGLMKIAKKSKDLALAKEALVKAVEISPEPRSLHALGRFYYNHEKDDEKACECFHRINGYLGLNDLIRLNLIRDPTFDPEEMLLALGDLAYTHRNEDDIYCDIGFYFLIFKRDLEMAVEYFWKVLMVNVYSHKLMKFGSYALCLPINYNPNMIEVLFNEVQVFKMNNDCLSQAGIKDVKFLKLFMKIIVKKYPKLRDLEIDPDRVQNIKKVVEDYRNKLRQTRYGGGQALEERSAKESEDSDEINNFNGINKYNGFFTQRSSNDEHRYEKRNKYNRLRYDTTITDWRSENRMRESKN